MEKTALEILEEFARKTNRPFEKSDQQFSVGGWNKLPKSERWISIKDVKKASFVSLDASSNRVDEYARISGIVIPVKLRRRDFSLKIAEKDLVDKLNLFKKIRKTNDKEIDRNFLVDCSDMDLATSLMKNTSLQKRMLNAYKVFPGLKTEVNTFKLQSIPEFEEKVVFCVFRQQWIFDRKQVEELFELAYFLHDSLLKNGIIEI